MSIEPAWLTVERTETPEAHTIRLSVVVASFSSALVIEVDAADWSQMLSNPKTPVSATAHLEAERSTG